MKTTNRKIIRNFTPNGRKVAEVRGADIVDRGTALEGQLRHMARNDSSMIAHVLRGQRTVRLLGIVPSWANLITSEWGASLANALDVDSLARYRAWWELIFEITTEAQEENRIQLAVAYLVQRKARKDYSVERSVDPGVFGVSDPELANRIEIATLSRFEALVPL
jgi:hypothetical protein